jgi:uncharacterized membrane protein YidH (DUF202 family)
MGTINQRRSPAVGRRLDARNETSGEAGERPQRSNKAQSWNMRSFVATTTLLSGLPLLLTGLPLMDDGARRVSAEPVGWAIAHTVLGVVFVVFCTWHIVLNRRAQWRYLRIVHSKGRGVSHPSREVGTAIAVLAVVTAVVLIAAAT